MDAFEPVREFLSQEPLSKFAEEHNVVLWKLPITATVADAVKTLKERNVLSLPILDDDNEYVGCISVADVARGLMAEIESTLGSQWIDRMDEVTKELLEEIGTKLYADTVDTHMHAGDLWLKGDSNTTLLSVCVEGFKVKEKKAHHRIWVCDPATVKSKNTRDGTTVINIESGSEKLDATSFTPTHVVSQMDVVEHIIQNKTVLELAANKTLDEVHAFMGSVFTVPASTTAIEAFHHMAADHKSCVGIVDEGRLIGCLSISDIRSVTKDTLPLLLLSVAEFIMVIHGKGMTVEQALAGGRVAGAKEGKWSQVLADLPIITLYENNTFNQLLKTVTRTRLHRVFVVNDDGEPVSIITLTDVLRTIVSKPGEEKIVEEEDEDEEEEEETVLI